MTINHMFLMVKQSQLPAVRAFYRAALEPIGYTEMIQANHETLIGLGSDYPYLWLKAVPDDQPTAVTHIAFDAPTDAAVDGFYRAGLSVLSLSHAAFPSPPLTHFLEMVTLMLQAQPGRRTGQWGTWHQSSDEQAAVLRRFSDGPGWKQHRGC